MSSRDESAVLAGVGVAALLAFLWFPYRVLLIGGAILAVLGTASLAADLRRGRAWHRQDVMVRKLWAAVKRLPAGYVLADPQTGELLSVEQERGWLTLAVTDPPEPGRQALVTRYPLGRWAAPDPPPLYRHMAGLDDLPPARWRWGHREQLAHFNAQSSALEVTADELGDRLRQLERSVAAARAHQQ